MNKKRILCFGDSNTYGYDTDTSGRFDDETRWTYMMAQALGEGYTVIEEGLSGRTTVFDDPLGEGLSGIRYLVPCLLTHNPIDLLIIMLGTNDTKQRFGATARNIANGMSRLVVKAQQTPAWQKEPQILIVSPPPITSDVTDGIFGQDMGDGCVEKSLALAGFYQETSKGLHCHFFDAGLICDMTPLDGMHLTRASHQSLGTELARQAENILGNCRS